MLDLSQIREKLQGRNIKEVSKASGLHYNIVYRMARGKNINPAYKTLKAISDFLKSEDAA